MAVLAYNITVNSNPVIIAQAPLGDGGKLKVYIANWSATDHVYIGGDKNVSTTNGYELPSFNGNTVSNRQEFELFSGDVLWGVCPATKTADIRVLLTGISN